MSTLTTKDGTQIYCNYEYHEYNINRGATQQIQTVKAAVCFRNPIPPRFRK